MNSVKTVKNKPFSLKLADEHAVLQRNYARLLSVFRHWEQVNSYTFSTASSDVCMSVVQRDRYSTVFALHETQHTVGLLNANACKLRAYHDAKMVDVLEWNGAKRFKPRYDYPNSAMMARDEKWQLNRFLGEWLDHCLATGRAKKITKE